MKQIKLLSFALLAMFFIASCEDNDGLVFTAKPSEEGVAFLNTFASNYLISAETEDNIAERFIWNDADFGAPVNVTYELQGSIDPTFATFEVVASTSETNVGVLVETLMDFASELGLDNDPATTDGQGNANNSGQVYFRVRAYTGSGGANTTEVISENQGLTITVIERAGEGCASLWVVGGGTPDAGWNWNSPIEFTCDANVYTARVRLANDAFRFFETEGDWASGINYPAYANDGFTIDAVFEDAMDNDNNFQFVGTTGIFEVVVDQPNKTITATASTPLYLVGGAITQTGWDWANRPEMPEADPYIFSASVELTSGETFRFFTSDGDWGSGLNYPYFEDEGYTIDSGFENAADGDSNFRVLAASGTYTLTVDMKAKTITLQ
ncbi:MAG: SusF/SusE family outer membrane protein [Cytophagia bacterium]|nr:SusF/SusE family outer membrane protein [Cytophagia bacterium]